MTESLCRYIDHSVLKPELTDLQTAEAIELGLRHNARTVCVRPADIPLAVRLCRGSQTDVCSVVSFPHGTCLSSTKAAEAAMQIDAGAAEIDMVANFGWIRSHQWDWGEQDIREVSRVTREAKVLLKVILETAALNADESARATNLAATGGADFVKTSPGCGPGGATEEAVAVMIRASAGRVGVKASGGIRDRRQAQRFVEMGCTRLGIGYQTTPVVCGPL
jgi:deoxyribose-phosphate aldolase